MNEPTEQHDAPTVRFASAEGLVDVPTTPVTANPGAKHSNSSNTTIFGYDKRTVMLLAFAAVGLLVLAGVAGWALSGRSSTPSAAGAATSTTSAVALPSLTSTPALSPSAVPPPPAPSVKPSAAVKPSTSSPSSPPPPPPPPPPAAGGHITGTIASKSGTTWTINADGGGPVQVAINASTAFVSSKKRSGNQFDVGQPVVVDGQQFGPTLLAATVTAPDPPHSAADPTTTTTTTTDPFANPNQQQPGYNGQVPGYYNGGQVPGYYNGGRPPGYYYGGQQPN